MRTLLSFVGFFIFLNNLIRSVHARVVIHTNMSIATNDRRIVTLLLSSIFSNPNSSSRQIIYHNQPIDAIASGRDMSISTSIIAQRLYLKI